MCVFDWGGGTWDCSICTLSWNEGVTVLATIGSNHNGGEDVDRELTKQALKKLAQEHDLILDKPIKEMSSEEYKLHSTLMREVKTAKEALCNTEKVRGQRKLWCKFCDIFYSSFSQHTIVLPLGSLGANATFEHTVTRDNLKDAYGPLLIESLFHMSTLFSNTNSAATNMDLLLTGGTSRMYGVREKILSEFPFKVRILPKFSE